jgi:hypothetical protein
MISEQLSAICAWHLNSSKKKRGFESDFMETVFCVHSALEDALTFTWEGGRILALAFSMGSSSPDKAAQVIPEVGDLFDFKHLNAQRNVYAHPGRVFWAGDRQGDQGYGYRVHTTCS